MDILKNIWSKVVQFRWFIFIFAFGCICGALFTQYVVPKIGFINKIDGYEYDTDTMRFVSAKDRILAISKLTQLLAKNNLTYTLAQIAKLNDGFIIGMLGGLSNNDEGESSMDSYITRLSVITSNEYTQTIALYDVKRGTFASPEAKQNAYNILSEYYKKESKGLPTIEQLNDSAIYFKLKQLAQY